MVKFQNGVIGKRTAQGPWYEWRGPFRTTTARQFAFDDYLVVTTAQSGLAGLVPLWGINAAQAPIDFNQTLNVIGLGGNAAPVGVQNPLLANTGS